MALIGTKDTTSPVIFTWIVEDFSTLDEELINSPVIQLPFVQAKIKEAILELRPQTSRYDFDPNSYTFINLDLEFSSKDDGANEIILWSAISLIDANGKKCFTQAGQSKFCNKKYFEFNWQYHIYRNHLLCPENRLLVEDKLTIQCEIHKMDKLESEIQPFNQTSQIQTKLTDDKISNDYLTLLRSGKQSDVILVTIDETKKEEKVKNQELQAHKCILSARSPVFEAMFEHDCKERPKNRVEIVDISFEVLQLLVEYIYSGKIDQDEQHFLDLLAAADKYQIICLKSQCEMHLCSQIGTDSVATIFVYADMHQAVELKEKCLDYITDHIDEVKCTEGWKRLYKNRPELGMELFLHFSNKVKKSNV